MKIRPLSPHLQIYKLGIAYLSITHRFTGVFLFIGLIVFFWMFIIFAFVPGLFINLINLFPIWLIKVVCVSWSVSFYYHYLNGIRHLMWDLNMGVNKLSATMSGFVVIILSVVLSLISCFTIFNL
ncbi:succinate dehydrogenase, cytochrome b556 subunit [Neoehrlichia mikurensis]|uniref:Succinate dehydrogenase cytochrome b556 subunit n=1 Tax=Neoehrlichia mikurensis TaxID=89586 RepID=A0A9Q9BYD7_9RICK|nr:succinate dehydrogenase, cytochrome b556 subunit [Neoehrlichia mikurensis]QXK92147.1 succinate dehydrogenase, cytochrome b556 subunit [Neoehrlichia mikurensis]QXK92604.1 succinate dehydrogenase, cytochrome b556 subunit [Neoehrlichia mikurensis]QXK93841.1 succinate dehydrogenase, cytochrome b556 subunit [Neoehrlichia mikurensis]UTO55164.1 succinate dehydrogenase, cytochrome b556 subunit [Neoehrlichia mikurensis]UTO56084.1 succinate dehydrogenase, cytochrome b556 subunit [Neoehrlichia mikuren